jgi:hypothetical protein
VRLAAQSPTSTAIYDACRRELVELDRLCAPVILESVDVSRCLPGPVTVCAIASSMMCRKTMSDSRRFSARMASLGFGRRHSSGQSWRVRR